MTYRVEYTARTDRQLQEIEAYISNASSSQIAAGFVDSIIRYCDGLKEFPKRGTVRDDLRPSIRLIGFRKRVTIAFTVTQSSVIILGVFYGGRDVEGALRDDPPDPQ